MATTKARRTSWAAPKQTLSLGPAFDKGWGETIMEYMTCSGGKVSASRGAAVPSRRRGASSPGEVVVGGFFFEFEAVRTASRDGDAPRRRVPGRHPRPHE